MTQRAWLLTRALITLEPAALARCKSGRASATRTEVANLARRRIKGSKGCVRASLFVRQKLETLASAPTMPNPQASFVTSNG